MKELKSSLDQYLMLVGQRFAEVGSGEGNKSSPSVVITDDQRLMQTVNEIETSPEFVALAAATKEAYPGNSKGSPTWWHGHVKNYFRLSGAYQTLYRDSSYDLDASVAHYLAAFTVETNTILYLAPVEMVAFDSEILSCGDFDVRRFSQEEFDKLARNSIRKVFYPWAHVDYSALADYWFICIKEAVRAVRPGQLSFDLEGFQVVKHSFSVFPKRVEFALKRLSLFNWEHYGFSQTTAPIYPHVPFVLEISDSLIHLPKATPSFADLAREPVIDDETGDEIGDRALVALNIGNPEEQALPRLMIQVSDQLKVIERYGGNRWHFIEMALGFLVKAILTHGIDQLLWNITAVEAILGENVAGGITEKLATRVAHVLVGDNARRKEIKEAIKELYSIRSKLVHGDAGLATMEIYKRSLHQARYSAREVVHWCISYLSHVANALSDKNIVAPTRKTLLKFIDMTLHERRESILVGGLLPNEFPNVDSWANIDIHNGQVGQ